MCDPVFVFSYAPPARGHPAASGKTPIDSPRDEPSLSMTQGAHCEQKKRNCSPIISTGISPRDQTHAVIVSLSLPSYPLYRPIEYFVKIRSRLLEPLVDLVQLAIIKVQG